jgi:hypothetical protein
LKLRQHLVENRAAVFLGLTLAPRLNRRSVQDRRKRPRLDALLETSALPLRERKRQPERRNKISIVTVGLPFFDQSIGRFRSGQTIADEVTVSSRRSAALSSEKLMCPKRPWIKAWLNRDSSVLSDRLN